MCMAAAELIGDSDVIFIDASTTAVQIADFISSKKSVTVVTNSIPLSVSMGKKGIKVYCTGGELQENSLGYAGFYAERLVSDFNFDLVFFSSRGVCENGMIADTSLPETMLRKAVLQNAKKSVFLCDRTKFFVNAPYNLMHISDIDCVITDMENTDIFDSVKEKIFITERS